MIRSEVRARVAANQPDAAPPPDETAVDPAKGVATPPPQEDRAPAAPSRARVPWLVRNSRKAMIALAIAAIAASPFAYRYLQREFGPDPFAGVKLDGVRIDPISGTAVMTKRPEAKPAPIRPAPAAVAAVPAPKPQPPRPAVIPAPPAPTVGVTHTRSAAVAPDKPPAADIPQASRRTGASRASASASEEVAPPRACAEAVTALGLCTSDSTAKGKGQTR